MINILNIQKEIHCLLAFVIIIYFSSCYSPRYMYSPATQNIPHLTQKGDVAVSGYYATGGGGTRSVARTLSKYNYGIDLHSSYAITDHFGIMINKYNRWEKDNGTGNGFTGDTSILRYNRSLTEFAIGYFTPTYKDTYSTSLQIFGGMAFGNFKIDDNSFKAQQQSHRYHYSHVTKIFIQPSIIKGFRKNFYIAFSSRLTNVYYHGINTNYNTEEINRYLLKNLGTSSVFFWEPAFNYSFSVKNLEGLNFNLQAGFSALLSKHFVDYRSLNLAIGVRADNQLFKKRK